MPDWSKDRGLTKNSPWSSRLGAGQWAKNPLPENMLITKTETRIATAPFCGEAEIQNVNARLEQRANLRMTLKPPMKLLAPKVLVRIGQRNIRTIFETGK